MTELRDSENICCFHTCSAVFDTAFETLKVEKILRIYFLQELNLAPGMRHPVQWDPNLCSRPVFSYVGMHVYTVL